MRYAPWSEGLALVLHRLHDELPGRPLLICEHGVGTDDDAWRCDVLRESLTLVERAIADGVDVRGFFHWTGVDNYEWNHGFDVQFGCFTRSRAARERGVAPVVRPGLSRTGVGRIRAKSAESRLCRPTGLTRSENRRLTERSDMPHGYPGEDDWMHLDLYKALAGLIVGFVIGLTGMGGGALMTPVLVLFFGINPGTAVSADVVTSLVLKPFGGSVHVRRRTVNWRLVRWLMIGSVPSAFAGAYLLDEVIGTSNQNTVKKLLGWVLLVAAGAILAKLVLQARRKEAPVTEMMAAALVRPIPTLVVGALGGLIVGMTSVGSGSLIIVMLMLMYPMLSARRWSGRISSRRSHSSARRQSATTCSAGSTSRSSAVCSSARFPR